MKKNIYLTLTILISSMLCGCSSDVAEKPINEDEIQTNLLLETTTLQEETTESVENQTIKSDLSSNTDESSKVTSALNNGNENISKDVQTQNNNNSSKKSTQLQENSSRAIQNQENGTSSSNLTVEENEETSTEQVSNLESSQNTIQDFSSLSNEKLGWYFNPNDEHIQPTASEKVDLGKYNAYYLGDADEKIIYFTFDEGYENGFSTKILDVLKEKNVKGAFFVTKSYINKNQELIKRMVEEGHVVGNHSVKHLSSPDLTDDELKAEIINTADYFKEVTGHEMPKVFRPPMGEYSERTLAVTQSLGYKTIFWSFAYKDWLTDNQPGKQVAYDTVMKRYHNGAILLLHAVSQSNTEALGDIIDSLREQGYTFGSLEDL